MKLDPQLVQISATTLDMSLEEWKVREELEEEVEKDLEKEIKDGIFALAKKLHNLYMHQRERYETKMRQNQFNHQQNKLTKSRKMTFSEVNISIKMEGATSIEIKDSKKEGRGRGRSPPPRPFSDNVPGNTLKSTLRIPSTRRTKFDWTKSLRSGSDISSVESIIYDKKRGDSDCMNSTALLEMGWKC